MFYWKLSYVVTKSRLKKSILSLKTCFLWNFSLIRIFWTSSAKIRNFKLQHILSLNMYFFKIFSFNPQNDLLSLHLSTFVLFYWKLSYVVTKSRLKKSILSLKTCFLLKIIFWSGFAFFGTRQLVLYVGAKKKGIWKLK